MKKFLLGILFALGCLLSYGQQDTVFITQANPDTVISSCDSLVFVINFADTTISNYNVELAADSNAICPPGQVPVIKVEFSVFDLGSGTPFNFLQIFDYFSIDLYTTGDTGPIGEISIGYSVFLILNSNNPPGLVIGSTYCDCMGPLPVELISFSAQHKYTHNEIKWETASETNNDYFSLEVSNDGINYKEIEKVKGAGNSNQPIKYSVKDYDIQEGVVYYRLKQVDFNGNSETFSPVALEIGFLPDYEVKYYDFIGREINENKLESGRLYIKQFPSGERKLWPKQ